MKVSKFFLGLALVLFAVAGAYAHAKTTVLDPIFYEEGGLCLPGEATVCDNNGSDPCIVLVNKQGGGTTTAPIFAAFLTVEECDDAYTRQD